MSRRASYTRAVALLCAFGFVGCSEERPNRPAIVSVGATVPHDWPTPAARPGSAGPTIEAMRFSTLDIALGSEWNGDAIASPETERIDVRTNLFDFTMPRIASGRFRFAIHMLDLPAFLVRPYALHVVARDGAGRETTLLVPFRIHGRV